MSRVLYFDCFSGASGDMVLGALVDAGLPPQELRSALGSLGIDGASVSTEKVIRAGLAATKFAVHETGEHRAPAPDHDHHHHDHDHGHQAGHQHGHAATAVAHAHGHRSLAEINALVERSALPAGGKLRTRALFQRLGEVEAAIHQVPVEKIHLHEVGSLDSIIDIVGAVFALEWFKPDRILSSPLNVGGGMVDSAHGRFPVPAPATAKLLEGIPVYSSGAQRELVTPTGALLISSYATAFGPIPPMTIDRIGYGAGDRDPSDTPNVLRVLIGQGVDESTSEQIVVLECEIDDMNPQLFGPVMDKLYAAGALEVYFAAVQMKKNRPGTLITILSSPDLRQNLVSIVFCETTTIGVPYHEVTRERLEREIITVQTTGGATSFKNAWFGGP